MRLWRKRFTECGRGNKIDSAHKECEVSWVDLSEGEACPAISVNWYIRSNGAVSVPSDDNVDLPVIVLVTCHVQDTKFQSSASHTRHFYHQVNVPHSYYLLNQFDVDQQNHQSLYGFSFRYSTFRTDRIVAELRSSGQMFLSVHQSFNFTADVLMDFIAWNFSVMQLRWLSCKSAPRLKLSTFECFFSSSSSYIQVESSVGVLTFCNPIKLNIHASELCWCFMVVTSHLSHLPGFCIHNTADRFFSTPAQITGEQQTSPVTHCGLKPAALEAARGDSASDPEGILLVT